LPIIAAEFQQENEMAFPDPDMATHDRLMGIAQTRPDEVGMISSEILSAVVCFLLGSVGPVKTAEIMREWAGVAQRLVIKQA
jgi:hypothetical protein